MTLHSISPNTPALPLRYSSFKLLPVVLQLYCGYCVNATARLTPSRLSSFAVSSVSGCAYRKATYALWGAVSGCSSSRSAAMRSPCIRVYFRIGEPPPMSLYCCSIWGVRRRAIHGAKTDWKGRGMRSPSEKRFLRKSWVSGTCGKRSRRLKQVQRVCIQ